MNFLTQLKRNAIPQLRNRIVYQLKAQPNFRNQIKFHNTMQMLRFLQFWNEKE